VTYTKNSRNQDKTKHEVTLTNTKDWDINRAEKQTQEFKSIPPILDSSIKQGSVIEKKSSASKAFASKNMNNMNLNMIMKV